MLPLTFIPKEGFFEASRFRGFGGISKLRFVPFAAKQLPLLPRYSDSAYTMSQWSTSLEPGVDCPDRATYLSAANWMGPEMSKSPDPRWGPRVWRFWRLGDIQTLPPQSLTYIAPSRGYTHHITKTSGNCGWLLMRRFRCFQKIARKAQEFWPICVFDWVEDHEIWRHMDGGHTRGYVRKTVVVRSIATVGHLDGICIRPKRWGIPWGWVFSVLNVRDSPKVTSLAKFDGHLWRWSLILSFLFGVSWIGPSFGSLLYGFLWLFVMWNMLLSLWWLFSGLHMEGVEYHLKSERLSATPPCDHCVAQIVNDSRWHHHKEFQWISEAGTPYLISLLWLFVMDFVFWSILVLLVFQAACGSFGVSRKAMMIQGNHDYIMDVKFREDGEINVETRFAGYPESLGRHMWAGVGVRYMKSMCDLFGGFRQPADVHPTWMKITHGLSEVDFAVISRLKAVKVEVYIVGVFSLLYLSFPWKICSEPLLVGGGGSTTSPGGMIWKNIYDASAEKTVPLILAFIPKIST